MPGARSLAMLLSVGTLAGCNALAPCPPGPSCQAAAPATTPRSAPMASEPPLEARAGSAAAYYALGRRLQSARHDAEAVKAYKRALQLDPGYLDASNGIAVVYALHGHHALAIGMLRQLVTRAGEKETSMAYLLNNLGYAYLLDSQYEMAVSTLEKAVALSPEDLDMLRNLGQALNRASQP